MRDDDPTAPFAWTPIDGASRHRMMVAFHGYIEVACREVAALAGAFAVADVATTLESLRGLCVALLAAETRERQLDEPAGAPARALMRRTLDIAAPWIMRVWNAAPGEVESIFRELAEQSARKIVRA